MHGWMVRRLGARRMDSMYVGMYVRICSMYVCIYVLGYVGV